MRSITTTPFSAKRRKYARSTSTALWSLPQQFCFEIIPVKCSAQNFPWWGTVYFSTRYIYIYALFVVVFSYGAVHSPLSRRNQESFENGLGGPPVVWWYLLRPTVCRHRLTPRPPYRYVSYVPQHWWIVNVLHGRHGVVQFSPHIRVSSYIYALQVYLAAVPTATCVLSACFLV